MQPFGGGDSASNIPAFLGKLWKMVNDPNTDHLICWSTAGNSFVIQNQAQFWYELLPLYYKHNNMSSFVRQLNMYGFHKMSTVENGTMDSDKDEIQFYHRYFQKDQPELLRNIKRKVTVSKSENNIQNVMRHEDMTKVLSDVKYLKVRQSSVDSQLSAMKQENAVLWRELAMLRQKHIKQQQIVNKLIQFLVTLVQPSASSRMGVGVKRRMPLMLDESPAKRSKLKKMSKNIKVDNGPTIHELDNEIEISPVELFDVDLDDQGLVSSPHTSSTSTLSSDTNPPASSVSSEGSGDSSTSTGTLPDSFWDKPEFVEINNIQPEDLMANDIAEEGLNNLQNNTMPQSSEKVFLNPTTRDTLLTNLVNGNYNPKAVFTKNSKKITNAVSESPTGNIFTNNTPDLNQDTTIATKDPKINSGEDLDLHLESAQSDIDQLKDILHGCGTLDANTLLGLFNEDAPGCGLSFCPSEPPKDNGESVPADPMLSGNELVTSSNNLIDFTELFDGSLANNEGSNASDNSFNTSLSSRMNKRMEAKSESSLHGRLDKDL